MSVPAKKVPSNPVSRFFSRSEKNIGENVGWQSYRGGTAAFRRGGLPRRLQDYLAVYGGTDDSVTWVYACVSLIAGEGASYQYDIMDKDETVIDPTDLDPDLKSLLRQPNPNMTYFDFAEYTFMDLELAGNAYWLKDQPNGYGQPKELIRLRPDLVQVATNAAGKIIGFVYTVQNIQIPYDVDEIIRFTYPNPLDDRYGMGTVEAIQRTLSADLAMTEHVTGFFSEGARISGILTVKENLSEPQFERIKESFRAQFKSGATNDFGVMVVEQGNSYAPLQSLPPSSGVLELRSTGKDEILSAFGIPEFLLGGSGQGGVYRMSEAQHIFSRAMVPKARRFSERMTQDLLSLWDLGFKLDVTITEPTETKIGNARAMLGMGASLNQVLDAAGLPVVDDDQADEPLIQQGILPFSLALKQIQAQLPPDPNAGFGGGSGGFGGSDDFYSDLDTYGGSGDVGELGPTGGGSDFTQTTSGPGFTPATQDAFATFAGDTRSVMRAARPGDKKTRPRTIEAVVTKVVHVPSLPEGYEAFDNVTPNHADPEIVDRVVQNHARVLKRGVPMMQRMLHQFFIEQRRRMIKNLPKARTTEKSYKFSTKQIDMGALWDDEQEDKVLRELYMQIADEIGKEAVGVGKLVGSTLDWTLTNPLVAGVRDEIGKLIVGVNQTTKDKIADAVETGMQRGYSIPQIANGFPEEDYKGISGVFDQATAARAETIARTETAKIYNLAATASYEDAGVLEVEVLDGTGDAVCKAASGQRWTLQQANENPIAHPNAILEGTTVLPLGRVQAVYRARWSGPVVQVTTAAGHRLTVTPNHPVLTGRGWVDADELHEGDKVVSRETQRMGSGGIVDFQQVPTSVENIFESACAVGIVQRSSSTEEQFHGDGVFCDGEIEVVFVESELPGVPYASFVKQGSEGVFGVAAVEHPYFARPGTELLRGGGIPLTTACSMGGSNGGSVIMALPDLDTGFAEPLSDDCIADAEFCRELARRYTISVTAGELFHVEGDRSLLTGSSHLNTRLTQPSGDSGAADSLGGSDQVDRLAVEVVLDEIVHVEFKAFHVGWAFDVQCEGRAYVADGCLSSNCVRSFVPIVPGAKAVAVYDEKARRPRAAATAIAASLSDNAAFNREHPRGQGGRFGDKPDEVKPSKPAKPKPAAKPVAPKVEQKPEEVTARIGSADWLRQIGIPEELVSEIERLGLDQPLKKRKKGDLAQKLLGKFEDTREKFTIPGPKTKDGSPVYTKDRRQLHDEIVDLMLRQKKPVFNSEKGFVEWQLDPEGEYVKPPKEMVKDITRKLADYDAKLASPLSSSDDERLRAERGAWQKTLVSLGDGRPKSMFLAGGNASGKSSALYSPEMTDTLKPDGGNVEINFDLIKPMLPEYQQMAAAHDIYGTDGTHFESADIAQRLRKEASARGLNVIVDASGNSTKQGFINTIKEMKQAGYETEVLMVDAPLETAVPDMMKRALKTGRYVPTPIMAQIHGNSVTRFDEWKDDSAVDRWTLYQRVGSQLTRAGEGGVGSGKKTKVVDQDAWDGVLAKKKIVENRKKDGEHDTPASRPN